MKGTGKGISRFRLKWLSSCFCFLVALWAGCFSGSASAREAGQQDAARMTEPGSGQMVAVPQGQTDPVSLPLQHTIVEAGITGVVASVRVEQVFGNPYEKPIEAIYVFPLPHNAAVYAMRLRIGERTIEGQIKPREEAQELYRQAREQGRTASLLDQERPNIFTQSVANILPGDDIRVELTYFNELAYNQGQYEFVFPMVVGPRYIPGGASGRSGTGWSADTDRVPDGSRISPSLLPPGFRSGHDIEVKADLETGVAFRDLETPSHAIRVDKKGSSRAVLTLAENDRIPNKDFILRWKVDTKGPVAGWMAHRGPLGGYFLLVVEPDASMPKSETARREYVFVIDTSGSMNGFPLDQCKRILKKCLVDLNSEDSFQVVLFAGDASTFSSGPVPATPENIRKALEYANSATGSGGTEFLPALEKALDHPEDPGKSRIVLFLSDGYIGYEAEVLKYMRQHRGEANVFPLGVGTSVNRYLIEAMARVGQGEPFYLTPSENPDEVVERFFRYVSRPALTGLEVDFQGIEVLDPLPEKLPDLFAGKPLSLVGKVEKAGRGRVVLTGRVAGRSWKQTLEIELPEAAAENPGLAYLWARRSIEEWSDRQAVGEIPEDSARQGITAIALRYSLMSAYTSFVAIDSQVRNPGGESRTVAVPVPLPDQVSPLAAPPHAYSLAASLAKSQIGGLGGGLLCERRAERQSADREIPFTSGGKPGQAEADFPPQEEPKKPEVLEVRIQGAIEEDAVRSVLAKALEKWARDKALSGLRGTVVLALEILPNGKVGRTWMQGKGNAEEKVLDELLKKARDLVFPERMAKSYAYLTLRW